MDCVSLPSSVQNEPQCSSCCLRYRSEQQTIRSELVFDDAALTFAVNSTAAPTSEIHADLHNEYDHPIVRVERAPDIVVRNLKTVGGVDISFLPLAPFPPSFSSTSDVEALQQGVATVVVLAYPSLEVILAVRF
jgi:hypothetical protein